MKTKSLVLALAAVALVSMLAPSQAQAGGRHGCGYGYGYNTYRGGYYAPVRTIRVVRPVRVVRAPALYVQTPLISIGFGFGGGRCRY